MNFDPYDSVAWRSFGMLDAGENTVFDEEIRQDPGLRRACQEMDRLSAAIAACTVEPVWPQAEQLERLQRRLGLARGPRKCPLWMAVFGWILAATLAAVLASTHFSPRKTPRGTNRPPVEKSAAPAVVGEGGASMETRRLHEEIQLLRRSLEEFHERDRVMFQVLPGRSLSLVMIMVPPGEKAAVRAPLTAMLGDALAATNRHVPEESVADAEALPPDGDAGYTTAEPVSELPMAVPIYDAARDAGTLVVSNLAPAGEGNVYNLWVVTEIGGPPVYIGSIPESSALGADSFDFSLGSSMVLPAGFLLTLDPHNAPASPTEDNTVLRGPPAEGR